MTDTIYVPTLTGMVDIANPDPKAITLKAMAHGLGKLDRWVGALEKPLYVAQHSVVVLEIFKMKYPQLAREGGIHAVLHDGHEYLIGDWTQPAVRLLDSRLGGASRHLDNIKLIIDGAIRDAFALQEPDTETRAAIHDADQIAAATEWRSLMPAANGRNPITAKPANIRIKPLSWTDAVDLFEATVTRELAILEHHRSAAE